jgi:hypothetical protein
VVEPDKQMSSLSSTAEKVKRCHKHDIVALSLHLSANKTLNLATRYIQVTDQTTRQARHTFELDKFYAPAVEYRLEYLAPAVLRPHKEEKALAL